MGNLFYELGEEAKAEIPDSDVFVFIAKAALKHIIPKTDYFDKCQYCDKFCNTCSDFQDYLKGAGYTDSEIGKLSKERPHIGALVLFYAGSEDGWMEGTITEIDSMITITTKKERHNKKNFYCAPTDIKLFYL